MFEKERNIFLHGEWSRLVVVVPEACFVDASGMALLAAWGLARKSESKSIEFYGDHGVCNYLSRMNLFELLDFRYPERFGRHSAVGRFLPLMPVLDEESVFSATNAICDLILHQFDNARDMVPAVEWCVNEVIDNVRLHAFATSPGIVCAQFYPVRRKLDFAIVDQGRGIRASLGERFTMPSDRDAIIKAFEIPL